MDKKLNYKEIRDMLNDLSNRSHKDYVKVICSVELNTTDEEFLNHIYDEYMDCDSIHLVNDFFYDWHKEYKDGTNLDEIGI